MDYYKKELRKIKNKIRDLIDPYFINENYCKFCWEKSSYKMTVHHRYYIENDITYNKYPDTIQGRIRYYNDLLPLVRENPERFLYLCIKCHNVLEYYLQYGEYLEDKIKYELSKKWSDFQYMFGNRHSPIAKYSLKELKLDEYGILSKMIDDRPYKVPIELGLKSKHVGIDEFFWS